MFLQGETFLDHLIINVRAGEHNHELCYIFWFTQTCGWLMRVFFISLGKGGNGCVAFHREKFKPFGPPSGGNGGRGGDVYILPTPHLTTLSTVPKRIRGEAGGNGRGTWQNGKNGTPLVIKVPLGTVVKELAVDDTRRIKDEWEEEDENLAGLDIAERRAKMRARRWVHYPRYEDDNVQREAFKDAETSLYRHERERRLATKARALQPIHLDLDKAIETTISPDAPLGTRVNEPLGHLIATGGLGGLGNPVFTSQNNRSPKFATRGCEGDRLTLSLELKILADVGLVGMPNAGKSTLLRALTGGRARTEVAGYAFTTLNPVVGVVRVADDGSFEGEVGGEMVHDETWVEKQREDELMRSGAYAYALSRNQAPPSAGVAASESKKTSTGVGSYGHGVHQLYRAGHSFDTVECFRFTIADNPGLISRASENVGLGHSFLRSMERSLALAYVVDLSGPAPWDELRTLRDELEEYKPGMSAKARMVIANKADLLGGGEIGNKKAEEEARGKLRCLEEFVKAEMDSIAAVIPISAKFSQNLRKVVGLLQGFVKDSRTRDSENKIT
jgi:GTPase